MGNNVNTIRHNKKRLLEALEKSLGIVSQACKNVGIDRSTFYNYMKADKEFRDSVNELENYALDFAEGKLMQEISKNNTTAIIFYLKCKAKSRGYVERQEHEITGNIINVVAPHKR